MNALRSFSDSWDLPDDLGLVARLITSTASPANTRMERVEVLRRAYEHLASAIRLREEDLQRFPVEVRSSDPVANWDYLNITAMTAEQFGVKPADLLCTNRKQKFAEPRACAWYLMRSHYRHTTVNDIARLFRRDHTTIVKGADKFNKLLYCMCQRPDHHQPASEAVKILTNRITQLRHREDT